MENKIDISNFLIEIDEIDSGGEVFLTDFTPVLVGIRHRLPSARMIKLTHPDIKAVLKPFAITFTYKINQIAKYVQSIKVFKNGNSRSTKVPILLVDLPPLEQWKHFKMQFYEWIDKCYRNKMIISEYHCFPEFTQGNLIHVHALVYHDPEGWATARAHLMASLWCKVSGSRMIAQVKHNGFKNDYAFALCNDVEAWTKYITKEQANENH